MRFTIGLITWFLLMSYGLFKPGNPYDPTFWLFPGEDKLIHFGLFGMASLLFALSISVEWQIQARRVGVITLIIGLFYASLTEPIQYFVPFRSPDFFDFLSNLLGVVSGWGSYQLLRRRHIIHVNP